MIVPKLKSLVVVGKKKGVSLEDALEVLPDGSYSWSLEEEQ